MAHVSHKLSGSVEGALAGGGDPATSPLYVFGPFLKLIVVAGVASVTFGASIWLAVLTVVTVSAMYRLVMVWVTDGSGGSGLNEEEFGPWAVKINAGITVVEYTLTFLVSMAALVTFIADRLPLLNERVAGVPYRTFVAIGLSVLTGYAVNRGPRVAARAFGPATAAVLFLLWAMIVATVWKLGFRLPNLQFKAFTSAYLGFTLGGYARILALMTGIEIFANLVAAYDGRARERSRKAFGSLLIVMGTTSLTMLIVGPAIHDLSDPLHPHVSVFTQTMDKLLPGPLAYAGTLIGIAVLLSAAAASAQGIQNLALGLRYRHYIPAYLGQKNRFDVADKPVWLEILVCVVCFIVFGTEEDTYLSLYAAGVFILLSLTGWAAVKRLTRHVRTDRSFRTVASLGGTIVAALLTTAATGIIFKDRFREGAWLYFLLIPALFVLFDRFRHRLGPPAPVEDRLGQLISASHLPSIASQSLYGGASYQNILVPLDGSPMAEQAFATAQSLGRAYGAKITLLSVLESNGTEKAASDSPSRDEATTAQYMEDAAEQLRSGTQTVEVILRRGEAAAHIGEVARAGNVSAVVMTTHGRSRWQRWLTSSVTSKVIYQTTPPVIVLRPTEDSRNTRTRFARLLVALDGSEIAEQVLPYVGGLANQFKSRVTLLAVPEGAGSDELSAKLRAYLKRIAVGLKESGIETTSVVEGSAPAQSILRVAEAQAIDLIMMVSHGLGGVARQDYVKLGSVVDQILQTTPCPVFLVSAVPPAGSSAAKADSATDSATDSGAEPEPEARGDSNAVSEPTKVTSST